MKSTLPGPRVKKKSKRERNVLKALAVAAENKREENKVRSANVDVRMLFS